VCFLTGAQEEVACLDVLVCGTCHYVFHFIEEFQEHKKANVCGKPTFKANLSVSFIFGVFCSLL